MGGDGNHVSDDGIGAHRKGSEALDLDRHGVKPETQVGQHFQIAQMLAHRNLRAQQDGMHRAPAVPNIVNIQGINADKNRTLLIEPLCGRFGQKRVAFEVLVRAPVSGPAGVYQHRFASHIRSPEHRRPDGARTFRGMQYQAFKIRE